MSARIRIHGLKELHAQLRALNDVALAAKVLAQAGRKAMKPVLETAIRMAPQPSGNPEEGPSGDLRASLKIRVQKPKDTDTVVRVGIGIVNPKAPKRPKGALRPRSTWHFVEIGTSKVRAHPFLRPALQKHANVVAQLLRIELEKSILRTLKRRARNSALGAPLPMVAL